MPFARFVDARFFLRTCCQFVARNLLLRERRLTRAAWSLGSKLKSKPDNYGDGMYLVGAFSGLNGVVRSRYAILEAQGAGNIVQ